jgi:hypothetical protein
VTDAAVPLACRVLDDHYNARTHVELNSSATIVPAHVPSIDPL